LAFGRAIAGLVLLLAGSAFAAAAEPAALHIIGGGDAIAPAILDGFARASGTTVSADVLDDPAALERSLLAGAPGFDLAVVPGESLARLIAAGALAPLGEVLAGPLARTQPSLRSAMAASDAGNRYAAPYMWGRLGFGFAPSTLHEKLGGAEPDSWGWLFKADLAGKLKDCGIAVLDAPRLLLPAAMRFLGLPTAGPVAANVWPRAADALMRVRGAIRHVLPDAALADALAGGDVCLAVAESRTVTQAARRARALGSQGEIVFVAPREGAPLWFDALVIPKNAAHAATARAFIAYALTAEAAHANADWLGQDSALTALAGAEKDFSPPVLDARQQATVDRLWQRVKAVR
jgi:putrescine transport system substrate-binding protein